MKWRLYEPYFQGPGQYRFNGTILDIALDGTFELSDDQTFPLYSIAAKVGGKRDRPYLARKQFAATAVGQIIWDRAQ